MISGIITGVGFDTSEPRHHTQEDVRLKELKWLNRMADSEIVNTAARNPHLASTLQHKLKEVCALLNNSDFI